MSHFNRREVEPWEGFPTQALQWNGLKREKKVAKTQAQSWAAARAMLRECLRASPTGSSLLPRYLSPQLSPQPHVGRLQLRLAESWCASACRKRGWGIKRAAVTLRRSAGEGCRLQAKDAARLLSVEKVVHLPASACHVAGKGSPPTSRTLFDPHHLLLHLQALSDTLSIYPFPTPWQDIHEVRERPGERPEEGRYAPLWAFLGLLPLCFWFWSLTGREIWPAWSHRLIFSMERWSYGWWNVFVSHRKKAKPLLSLCLRQHKDCLFLACADLNNVSPLRKMISGHCLQGTQETAFGKAYWRAQPGHSSPRDMWSCRSSSAPL